MLPSVSFFFFFESKHLNIKIVLHFLKHSFTEKHDLIASGDFKLICVIKIWLNISFYSWIYIQNELQDQLTLKYGIWLSV